MPAFSRILFILALYVTVVLSFGCGIFETRDPEEPGDNANVWNPPSNPRDVLDNISLAFTLRDGLLYMKSFARESDSDSAFSFYPDAASSGGDTVFFSSWGYEQEQAFIMSLFSPDFIPSDSACSFQFTAESEPPGENMPVYREEYTIIAAHTHDNLSSVFTGKVDIQFDRNYSGDWVIINWWDEQTNDNPTLSELKYVISN